MKIGEEQQYLTVSVLNKYIKRKFDYDPHLETVFVKGEISNFKQHSSGHLYFTLKDEKAVIQAVMFRNDAKHVKFAIENGMKVLVVGNVTTYEAAGTIQLYVKKIQLDGIGDLFVRFQQLKENLGAEGLFDARHKQRIPAYPSKVAVITSPTGAAVRDILTTIKRRFPIAKVIVYPAIVQGEKAAHSLVTALAEANSDSSIDVMIIGRGGGSIEDLWAFNEEAVVRAIFQSTIPTIAAVGHETDVTIADYVADMRAPTPTGAAELATPHFLDLLKRMNLIQNRIYSYAKNQFQSGRERLAAIEKSYAFRSPKVLIQEKRYQLDHLREGLMRQMSDYLQDRRIKHQAAINELYLRSPGRQIAKFRSQHELLTTSLTKEMKHLLQVKQQQFFNQTQVLQAVDPLKIMTRGYAAVFDHKKEAITSIKSVTKGDSLSIKVTDGTIECTVNETRGEANE